MTRWKQVLGGEDVASYEDLFDPLAWEAIVTGDWSRVDEDEEVTW